MAAEAKKKVLVIDDDPTYMKMIRSWLMEDYSITMTISGEQAFSWLDKNRPDMILLDYEMPVMPGPQVLEKLRDNEATKDIPVVMLTGKSDRESIMRILSLNPAGYLLKNIGCDELRMRLGEIFFQTS